MRTINNSVIVILSAALVAACGGGGGGDETGASVRAPLAINAGNGVRLAKDVVAGAEAVNGSGDSLINTTAQTRSRSDYAEVGKMTYKLVQEQLDAVVRENGAITTAATVTQNCPGAGTRTIDGADNNKNGKLDAGDSARFTYNNCAESGVVVNGILDLTVVALRGDANSTSTDWSLNFGLGFDNLSFRSGAEGFVLKGGYNLAASYTAANGVYRFVTKGAKISFASGADIAQLINFNFTDTLASASSRRQVSYNLTHDNSDFAGSVTVVTNVPFRGVEGFPPESGKLTIRGANGSRVVVEATGGGTATISIDANGDGDFIDSVDRVVNGSWMGFFG